MPEEIEKDVNTEEPSASEKEVTEQVIEEVVKEEVVADPQPEVEAPPETPPPVPDSNQGLYDENGVPWKNRAMEYKRKTEDLAERLPTMLEEAIAKSSTGQPKQSREELERFASYHAENPEYANWAKTELRKLDKEEQAGVVRNELERWKTEQDNRQRQQTSNNYAVQSYPDAFAKNVNGQFLLDNSGDPVPNTTNQLGAILNNIISDPRMKSQPDKLAIASDIAYAHYMKQTQGKTMQTTQKLKEEVGSLKKKTLVEGGGKSSQAATPTHVKALDRLSKSGTINDAKDALDALIKHNNKE